MSDGKPTVLFDLDGVLLRGDTMASLVVRRLVRHPRRMMRAAPTLARLLGAGPETERARSAHRRLVQLALDGLERHEYEELAVHTARRLAADPRRRVAACVRAACMALHRGERVLVVTATERVLARAYLDAIGLRSAELSASELGGPPRRLGWERHNVGEAKVESVRELGVAVEQARFFTDSVSDLPLALRVRAVVLVNPSRRSARVFRDRIPGHTLLRG
ncbi:haloacid dehalogenase-like hydrolase [Microbacterium sp. Kw_RZR3]|uniref:haloacid dehalogenase-like hydrolase n=1 Tax=Microbacterium sp. Kw_RZR3 TaxID=3032903 RepID=UPI0023DCB93D|nr:haloacid dehalogenase-like hydrolase [Microbacterium sp. Kw_RZR3]MDF2048178.1 haloacid dehalogenase-like hydrolase [Microbacterium sp. Kw_RZR3]